MNISHSFRIINSKNIQSHKYNPYLLSNKENISNNLTPIYLSSESNFIEQKKEINPYNDVKKNLNLDINEFSNNSINPKKDIKHNFHHFSSFSVKTSNINKSNLNINDKNKKTLILDLDETLVHSAFSPFSRKSDLMLTINFDGEDRLLYVLKRPHVDEFLFELSSLYEIIIFTASISEYANPLLDLLDKKKCIKHRLFREHCTFDNGIYIKDLKIFDRKINNMIIIDNNPLSYDNNISNGIPILSWYEDTNDKELLKLIPILKYMSMNDVYDVRNIINKIVDRNRNEIDYNAINTIINSKKEDNKNKILNNSHLTKNEYRKMNKSEEPKAKILNNKDIKKEEGKYHYNLVKNNLTTLKNNFENQKDNNNKMNILNSKYNIHNIYNYAFDQKPNVNIDKKDPLGTRISIFAPEEYNTSYKNKSFHFPFNRNMYTINYMEESKIDNFSKTINPQLTKNNYIIDKQNKNLSLNKMQSDRSLSYKNDENKINKNNNFENRTAVKVVRAHSLVDLTKKALHLIEAKEENKSLGINYITNVFDKNKNDNEEKRIIYNNYINGNRYINNHKSDIASFKNILQKNNFRNYIREYKNNEKDDDDEKMINMYSQIILLKQVNSNNKKDFKKVYNNNFINSEKDRLLKRINNEKINNFLGRNNLNEGKNYENKYISNYGQINKESYINQLKKSIEQNKTILNMKVFSNSNINYTKTKNNLKMYSNKRYDLLNDYKNKDVKNIAINHKSISYITNKGNNLVNLKQSNSNKNEIYNMNTLMRSSSFVKPNVDLNKIMNNFSIINSNKENDMNRANNKYVDNLNYRYDININGI